MRRGTFQNGYHHYLVAGRAEGRKDGRTPSEWNEALYLRANPDVQREVNRGTFLNGYHHYLVIGRSENREGGTVPSDWDEAAYLQINQDVEYQISQGFFLSGYHHYLVAGRAEKRLSGNRPAGWDEAQYLATNPAARTRIALGEYKTGYAHYAAVGREQGLLEGLPPADPVERLRLHWPELNRVVFQLGERFRMIFSTTVVRNSIATVFRQSEPASFDDRGVRIWSGQGRKLPPVRRNRKGVSRELLELAMVSMAATAAIHVLLHQRGNRRHHIRSVPFHAASGLFGRHGPAALCDAAECFGSKTDCRARSRRTLRVLAQGARSHQ